MDSSYKRYRKYRANRYQYKVDQVTAPIVMMLVIGFITDYWWIIIIGIAFMLFIRFRKKCTKQITVEQMDNSGREESIKQKKEISFQTEEVRIMSTTEVGYVNKNNQRNNQGTVL